MDRPTIDPPPSGAGVDMLRALYTLMGEGTDEDRKADASLPLATLGEMCGELAGVLGLLMPSQWQARCQLQGMMAVAYTMHGSVQWLEDAEQLLEEAEQSMRKHDVVALSEVSRGQAAVALLRCVTQRGITKQDASRLELDLAMAKMVRQRHAVY